MTAAVVFLAVWLVLSVPVGVATGYLLRGRGGA